MAPERRRSLLEASAELAGRVSASSPVRAACLRFQAAFLARPEAFYADPATGLPLIDEAEAAAWLKVSAGRLSRPCCEAGTLCWQELPASMTSCYELGASPL